ncbi:MULTISPECIES: BCCT family transporter [unclassified Brevibacterium]|uniref:BCCT family transporter n=1 Tax=unclassified Brevibacterium TaxID=2614124 RepID=UPI001E3350B7|nr:MULTISPECIES: BCCT family transporter [unclassified Brevibacterium]MCD1287497.1 choline transporter [Brevibacterium sp. CCUG 69071]MDK8436697.1 BCCT family transporter [Brevibacterium sp. H-BE7]
MSDETTPEPESHTVARKASRDRLKADAKRVGRETGKTLGKLDYARPRYPREEQAESNTQYPHNTHPILVPGIAIDEQRRRYSLDKVIFAIAGTLTVAFVIWGIADSASVASVAKAAYDWSTMNVGWFFNLVAIIILVALLILAFSPYGKIPLGKDGEKSEFSTFSWVAMLFAAGIGIGVLFFGPSEPLTYFISPPPLTNEAETTEALHTAMAQTYFHWGFHAWAMYALVGGAIAYAAYRRGRSLLLSSIFVTLFGKRQSEGFAGKLVDIFAIVATLFGTAAALGIAAMQIGTGVSIVSGVGPMTNNMLVVIICVLTVGFIISAVSGVSKGIRYLSSINIILTVGIVALVLFLGPTLFLLNLLPSALMEYMGSLFDLMGRSLSWGAETQEFQSVWTVYYWAWWISWSPFVGTFIARISRGRSIRQFILGTIFIPSTLLFVAYGIMGGTSISMYRSGAAGFTDSMEAPEVFFTLIDNLPYVEWLPFVAIIVLAIFFITSADSASVVMGMLASRGDQEPKKWVVVFWGLVMSGIAVVMLLLGDASALEGLQQLVIVTAVPFAVIMLFIVVAWFKELRTDPHALRRKYAQNAMDNAVIAGADAYGDNFALQVVETEPGDGANGDIDSEHEDYTDWYQRTDEDGEPVGYDYETGRWDDGWTPESAESEESGASEADTGESENTDPSAEAIAAERSTAGDSEVGPSDAGGSDVDGQSKPRVTE